MSIKNEKEISLCNAYQKHFPIGAAVRPDDINGEHKEILLKHFNVLVAENHMKFENIQPLENQFNFEQSDKIVNFAVDNNMKMRGHTLVWHNQTPEWVFKDVKGEKASRELLLKRMKNHINEIMNHYKGKVYVWDVVNEAIEDFEDKSLRDTQWLDIIGEDYIKIAFQYAKEADSEAVLFYNDYNNEQPKKLEKTYKLLKKLIDEGTPIDGVGIQAHWDINDVNLFDNLRNALEKYSSLGLQIQITEMDISMFSFEDQRRDSIKPTKEMIEKQAEVYEKVFSIFREYQQFITGVLFWGISDEKTWKSNFPVKNRQDWPLVFDENHQEKPAFYKIVNF
ncbi:endo-1,4-beta-xylanase [Clostridium grantii]|uniref:Beta-xylanase n=1 Tax=Clostridium grantii DSM 8605 TaxID=1121316 RepID=A0A1M5TPQ7_9CLOT|nr:endo-1,4-beta-xylanase [Clostridium grantii]SHH52668.1 endo-1,4-beta-xylanase [Clostridium grantii DSM 8605]